MRQLHPHGGGKSGRADREHGSQRQPSPLGDPQRGCSTDRVPHHDHVGSIPVLLYCRRDEVVHHPEERRADRALRASVIRKVDGDGAVACACDPVHHGPPTVCGVGIAVDEQHSGTATVGLEYSGAYPADRGDRRGTGLGSRDHPPGHTRATNPFSTGSSRSAW